MNEQLFSKVYWLFLAGTDEKRSIQLQIKKCLMNPFWNHSILFVKYCDKINISFRLFLSSSSGYSSFYSSRIVQKGYFETMKNKYLNRSKMLANSAFDFLKTIFEMKDYPNQEEIYKLLKTTQSYLQILKQIEESFTLLENSKW